MDTKKTSCHIWKFIMLSAYSDEDFVNCVRCGANLLLPHSEQRVSSTIVAKNKTDSKKKVKTTLILTDKRLIMTDVEEDLEPRYVPFLFNLFSPLGAYSIEAENRNRARRASTLGDISSIPLSYCIANSKAYGIL